MQKSIPLTRAVQKKNYNDHEPWSQPTRARQVRHVRGRQRVRGRSGGVRRRVGDVCKSAGTPQVHVSLGIRVVAGPAAVRSGRGRKESGNPVGNRSPRPYVCPAPTSPSQQRYTLLGPYLRTRSLRVCPTRFHGNPGPRT